MRLRARAVDHVCEAYALRVEHAGRAWSTAATPARATALVELARGADVLLCEATWPHTGVWGEAGGPPPRGAPVRAAGRRARRRGRRGPAAAHPRAAWFDREELLAEAKEAFDGPVELVAPDASYDLG